MVPEELLWLCGTIGSQRFGITLDRSIHVNRAWSIGRSTHLGAG